MSEDITPFNSLLEMHASAIFSVNRWRGRCIDLYARLERSATNTLALLPSLKGKKPQVFGERLKQLSALTASDGARPNKKVHASLADMADLLARRNLMVHAIGAIYIDGRGSWLWHYSFQPSKTGAEEEIGSFTEAHGILLEDQLAKKVKRVCAQLETFREALKGEEAVKK